jgi:hypothetical protein
MKRADAPSACIAANVKLLRALLASADRERNIDDRDLPCSAGRSGTAVNGDNDKDEASRTRAELSADTVTAIFYSSAVDNQSKLNSKWACSCLFGTLRLCSPIAPTGHPPPAGLARFLFQTA